MIDTAQYSLWRPADVSQNHWDPNMLSSMLAEFGIDARSFSTTERFTRKAADSIIAGPLIRQDLEDKLYRLFVQKFPFFDMIKKLPANGLVHAWNQVTSYGDAVFQTETGTVTDDNGTYVRQTAPIAELATRRGTTLKSRYAVMAGGMGYDPEAEELANGAIALRHKMQAAMLRYNAVNAAATTATDPDGLYDANSMNGLRWCLTHQSPAANTVAVDVHTADTTFLITNAIKQASDTIIDAGGEPKLIIAGTQGARLLDQEQMQFVRYVNDNGTEVIPGVHVKTVDAGQALLPFYRIPGDGMGTYISGGDTYLDLMVLDTDALSLRYLGGATPTVLDIPIGVDGKLQKLYIMFMMAGLVVEAAPFIARVQVRIA
jgi:hypothetical protein